MDQKISKNPQKNTVPKFPRQQWPSASGEVAPPVLWGAWNSVFPAERSGANHVGRNGHPASLKQHSGIHKKLLPGVVSNIRYDIQAPQLSYFTLLYQSFWELPTKLRFNPSRKFLVATLLLATVPKRSLTNCTFKRSLSVVFSRVLSSTHSRSRRSDFTKKLLEPEFW